MALCGCMCGDSWLFGPEELVGQANKPNYNQPGWTIINMTNK